MNAAHNFCTAVAAKLSARRQLCFTIRTGEHCSPLLSLLLLLSALHCLCNHSRKHHSQSCSHAETHSFSRTSAFLFSSISNSAGCFESHVLIHVAHCSHSTSLINNFLDVLRWSDGVDVEINELQAIAIKIFFDSDFQRNRKLIIITR